jgi:uncharacterized membrane protein
MVLGHVLDALLSAEARATPAMAAYWKARGLTAPLFLVVAGWAVTVAVRRRGARGPAVVRERLPRVLLLLLVGVALRWPGWGAGRLAAGDPSVWAHLLGLDALHVVALSVLGASLVFALGLTRREERLAFALLLAAAMAWGMRTPDWHPATLPALALEQLLGGTSPFPLVPWAGYFLAGCLVGLAVEDGSRRAAARLAVVGAALVAATFWQGVGSAPPASPALVAFRIGMVLLLLSALSAVPARLAGALAPAGRLSLPVYALHLPVVYGWSTLPGLAWRVGPTLGFGEAAAVALLVLAGSLAAAALLASARRGAGRLAEAAWAALQRTSAAR